jgi:FAD/FMN-containing dehydrogenase
VNQSLSIQSISQFEARLNGRLIRPGDADYDEARTIFLGGFNGRPALIVRPADAADVAHTVTLARETGVPLAIRSGGHSGVGHSTVDGGIVLDLRDMKALDIDPIGRTAWAETGLSAGEYTAATGVHGLATGFGDTGSVGIGGLTLSGGIGYLVRKHGLTIDSVLGAELVTADGGVLHVDASSHPELFWAIRGGGGNFGIVTRFCYQLQPVDHVVGGMLLLPATAEVIVGAAEAADAAPEELSIIANVMPAPPMPFVPESVHGQLVVMILLCYAGGAEAGARAVAPLRALATPIADMVRPMRYPDVYPPDDPSYHPKAIGRTLFIDRVDQPTAATIVDHLQRSDASLRVAQIRVLGGAMGRVPADETAFAHRHHRILVNVASFYEGPDDRPTRESWVKAFAAALDQGTRGAYVGFVGDEGEAGVRAAYPDATRERLATVKARYDPTNLFRRNHNIAPGVVGAR